MPFITQRLTELSAALKVEDDVHESCLLGDSGFEKGKLLPKPKARMDAYWVGHNVFNVVASSVVDAPLRLSLSTIME